MIIIKLRDIYNYNYITISRSILKYKNNKYKKKEKNKYIKKIN